MRVPGLQSRPGRPSDGRAPDLRDDRIGRERTRGLPTAPVRVRRVASASLWISLLALAALLLAIPVADAQTPQTLVSNFDASEVPLNLPTIELAQGFTTGPNLAGYTLVSIVMEFETAPSTLNARLLTGLPNAANEVATLIDPVSLTVRNIEFTAPADTVLAPNTTYFLAFQGTGGNAIFTAPGPVDSGGAPGWTIDNQSYGLMGSMWISRAVVSKFGVNGYIRVLPPASQPPDPANFARGPVQWLDQSQHEAQASTHAFSARRNEISANKPSNPSGSLDLGPVSENLRQPSRGFYLTTTIDQPGDAAWLFHRTPDGGYAVQDAQSRRYELAPGAALLKLRLWHIYHHLGRGLNSVQLLGGSTINDRDNRLTEPLQLCLPAPDNSGNSAERARIAVRGRYDRHWTILDTTRTDDGRICARTDRIAWLIVVFEPPEATAA